MTVPDYYVFAARTMAVIIAVAVPETTANPLGASVIRMQTPGQDGARLLDTVDAIDGHLLNELLRRDGPVQALGLRTDTTRGIVRRGPTHLRSCCAVVNGT